MSTWKETHKDIGAIKLGTTKDIRYELSEGSLDGLTVKPGCGSCTTIKEKGNNFFVATFRPDAVGKHVKAILIKKGDTTIQTLNFSANVSA